MKDGWVMKDRKLMILVGSGFRGFFAPFVPSTPMLFNPTQQGRFDTNTPPAGWSDLGWIDLFRRSPAGRIGQIRSGYRGAVRTQYLGEIMCAVEFEFREWGELQSAIARGTTDVRCWSAVFVIDTADGSQLYYYYPQLSIQHNEREDSTSDSLRAEFNALAFQDPVDGETVVCYRGFFPAKQDKP